MQVLVNTDHNIEGREGLTSYVTGVVEAALSHESSRITRVEVHLSDVNGDKKDADRDMRCMMEARLAGTQPLAVTHEDATVNAAVEGAADKLARLIEHTMGRLRDTANRAAAALPRPG